MKNIFHISPHLDTQLEQILVNRLINGDRTAFSSIFEAYYRDLVMFACTFTGNLDSAEETVQNVFVNLWEKHHELKLHGQLKSYLLKSVQNECLDGIRRRKVRDAFAENREEASLAINDTENYILYTELQERLNALLEQMPGELAETFRMNRFEGLKYREIALQMNVSVRTVESRISKALQMLHRALQNDYKP